MPSKREMYVYVYDTDQAPGDFRKFEVDVDAESMVSIEDLQRFYTSATRKSIKPGVWDYNGSSIHKQWYAIKILHKGQFSIVSRDKIEKNEKIILEQGDAIYMYLVHN